jgi:hypothetical protein
MSMSKNGVLGIAMCALMAAAGAAVLSMPSGGRSVDSIAASAVRPGGVVSNANPDGREEALSRYIVVYREDALAGYHGDIAGLPAPPTIAATTSAGARSFGARGKRRMDVRSPQARGYLQYLERQQRDHENKISRALGRGLKIHGRMQHALNGGVMDLTSAEATRVRQMPEVALIEEYREYQLDSDVGPRLIGAEPIWNGTNPGSTGAFQGEGVVFGIIDTGINFGSPSFAAVGPVDGYQAANPLGTGNYLGTCASGGVDAGRCNDKLIGGYDFVCGAPGDACGVTGIREEPGFGDTNSHGSHTASTAAGNRRDAVYKSTTVRISGVAPHANVIAYDVCYTTISTGQGSCPNTSSVAAVDQAVADGVVDVINFSIGGGAQPWSDAVSLAFLNAVDAGIYVATSAGNSGPGPNTMGHHEPWTGSTAAATHTRGSFAYLMQVTGPGTVPDALKAVILSEGSGGIAHSAALPGTTPFMVSAGINAVDDGCAAYPAGTFQNAIAMIRRGTCSFSIKVNNAAAAGAAAVVIANNQAGIILPSVPGTTIPVFSVVQTDGNAIAAYSVSNPGMTAAIGYPPSPLPSTPDVLASFSSRGPAANFDLIKPDVTAPGVNILAVVAGTTISGSENAVDLMNGTSMASPHHAGAAGLMRQAQPTWTVPEIKSALAMTAAQQVFKEDSITPADAFAKGSGRIQVDQAVRAGLVLNETKANYLAADPSTGGNVSALNQPSMANGRCAESCSFTRVFRNTLSFRQSWTLKLAGVKGTVSPALFTINPGESKLVKVTVYTSTQPNDGSWAFGSVTLQPGSIGNPNQPLLRLPIAVSVPPPVLALTPKSLSVALAAGSNGTATFNVANLGGSKLNYNVDNTGTGIYTPYDFNHGAVTSGFRSSTFTDPATAGSAAQYSADDFVLTESTRVTSLFMEGFVVSGQPIGSTATNLSWNIYRDVGGNPEGHPLQSPNLAVWTYTALPTSTAVDLTGNNIRLNLVAAGQNVVLPPGRYWVMVSVRTTFANRFAWYGSPSGDGTFRTITITTAGAGAWASNNSFPGLALQVRGEVSCGAPWLGAATPTMGTIASSASSNVQFQLNTSGLAAGSYAGYACFSSNDPFSPKVAGRVTVAVSPSP